MFSRKFLNFTQKEFGKELHIMEFAKLIDKIRRDLISDDEVKSMLSTMEVKDSPSSLYM